MRLEGKGLPLRHTLKLDEVIAAAAAAAAQASEAAEAAAGEAASAAAALAGEPQVPPPVASEAEAGRATVRAAMRETAAAETAGGATMPQGYGGEGDDHERHQGGRL